MKSTVVERGRHTRSEIFQQPELWLDTVERAAAFPLRDAARDAPVCFTGAGTSAYAAAAIAAVWPGAYHAIPSTDLLVGGDSLFQRGGTLISVARSGDSPESLGVIDRMERIHPQVRHFAITCNASGGLAKRLGEDALILDPRTNDRSLVMTSSFSNLTLAGLCFHELEWLRRLVAEVAGRVRDTLAEMDGVAEAVAQDEAPRVVFLASRPLFAAAQEACLKILEMTAGRVVAIPETYLGLRHGPMSFLRPDTLVVGWLSNDPACRRYEEDLLRELRDKRLGRTVCIGSPLAGHELADVAIPAAAPELPDALRTPFEIVFAQLLGYHMSLRAGLDPDNPSPDGVIHRVVQGVRLYA